MTFTVTYRGKEGALREESVEAASRAECVAECKARGIAPVGIREGRAQAARRQAAKGQDTQDRHDTQDRRRVHILIVLGVVGVLALGTWWWLAGARDARPYQVMTPQGPVTLSVATPLPRQTIPGDRQRIGNFPTNLFAHAAEAYLARYAEPGRSVARGSRPVTRDVDFKAALREPIRIASNDYTEWVDLKRIVTGMKREMQVYLAGGGTAEGYLAELEKRQKLEISYRERAEQRLAELLKGQNARQAAYDYWLKANAQLKSMGIYELPLPDDLRTYQMGMEIED